MCEFRITLLSTLDCLPTDREQFMELIEKRDYSLLFETNLFSNISYCAECGIYCADVYVLNVDLLTYFVLNMEILFLIMTYSNKL